MKKYEIHIKKNSVVLNNSETGEYIEIEPIQITVEFQDNAGNYKESKVLSEILEEVYMWP